MERHVPALFFPSRQHRRAIQIFFLIPDRMIHERKQGLAGTLLLENPLRKLKEVRACI